MAAPAQVTTLTASAQVTTMAAPAQVTTLTAPAQGLLTQAEYNMSLETVSSIQIFVSIFGLIANIINIKTFLAMRAFGDGVTLTFLLLSVSDLFVCLYSAVICVSTFLVAQESKWHSPLTTSQTIAYYFPVDPTFTSVLNHQIYQIFNLCTILLTIYLAVARCLCVLYPLKFRSNITVRTTLLVSVTFIVSSFGIRLPLMTHGGVSLKFDPRINATRYRFWVHPNRETIKDMLWVSVDAPVCVGAQITLSVCIVMMAKVLKAATKFRSGTSIANDSKSDQSKAKNKLSPKDARIVKQLVLISSIFIICNTPKLITFLATTVEPNFDFGKQYQNFYQLSIAVVVVFDTINSSANILVYYFFNAKFRSILTNTESVN
ncbi:chemosensory receptor c [Plakobranchus ocellatus]|uniref:Chemosensory receptor c n=1 Tax=Plakobranchus ocellatus TaxID=259542 RepID=A0AAV3YS17_9GAST|nr:chemosensory receptor c [Plakobranchus ocellatus]